MRACVSGAVWVTGRTPLATANSIACSVSAGLPVTWPTTVSACITIGPTGSWSDPASTPTSTSRPRGRSPSISSATGSVDDAVLMIASTPPSARSAEPADVASLSR